MTDFRERYKRLGFDPEENRALRSHRRDEARRGLRDEEMSLRREMGTNDADDSYSLDDNTNGNTQESGFSVYSQDSANFMSTDSQENSKNKTAADHEAAVPQRWERLQKWREEKNKRKQIEKKKAKPVFKVGVVHHRVYSPPVSKEPAPLPIPKLCRSRDISANMSQAAPKRVTRATEKRLAVKNILNQQKKENARSKQKPQPQVHNQANEDKHMEIAPKDHIFKAPMGLTPMPIFGRHALEATKENIQAEINSFQISTTNNIHAFSDVFDESSLSLKLSSDDQEMLDDSVMNEAKSPVSRHSSKNLSPPAVDEAVVEGVTPKDQEMMEVEQASQTEKSNSSFSVQDKSQSPVNIIKSPKVIISPLKVMPIKDDSISSKQDYETPSQKRKSIAEVPNEVTIDSPRRTRSTRTTNKRRSMRIPSTDSADSGIEPSSTPDEQSLNRRRSMKVSSIDSETDSISIPGKKENSSTNKRRSSTKVESTEIEPMKLINERRSSKLIANGSADNEEDSFMKPAASRRRSMKVPSETLDSNDIVTVADVYKSLQTDQESEVRNKTPIRKKSTRFTTNNQEKSDFENTNLMDFTFSAPAKIPKVADEPKSLLDDSVSNLTPRRSSRLPPTASTSNSDQDQPLIRFSSFHVPATTINESSSSEPAKQQSPNDYMNLSLNMLLPKESEEEKPPAFFSPYIVQSRGKNSAMKEMKKRRFSQPGWEAEDIPTKDNIMQKLNISVNEEERTAQYYKLILSKEIERLNEICDHWNEIKEKPETPEEAQYIIQAACGQTQLLINKKFERFRSLVQDCETGRGEMLVTCKDLQGFWEMMYMEIKDCDSRFNKLEEMKVNNWIAEEDKAVVGKKKKKAPAKKPAAKKPTSGKPSSLRAMIAAARKKKTQAIDGVENSEEIATETTEKPIEEPSDVEKPASSSKSNSRHSSTPKSASKWDNLLKKVQLSQTRKVTTSPLVVMKLSQMVKTPEVHLDDSIVYINSGRTPAKSILKKDEVMGSVSKSTHKVFFREQSNEVKEFESRNSFVDNNMSLDDIEEVKEPIERKLNFEDDSFVENREDKNESSGSQSIPNFSTDSPKTSKAVTLVASPVISMSPLSLEDKESESSGTKKKSTKTKKQISFKDGIDVSQPRSLRARKFSAPLTPIPKHRNQEDIEEDISMEVNDAANENHGDTPRPNLVKEIYLNEFGVVCERFVPLQKCTPSTSKLKRSVSDSAQRNRRITRTLESDESVNTPLTPRSRGLSTNVPAIEISTPKTVLKELSIKDSSSSPRSKKQSLKRSFADTTLTQDSIDVSMEDNKTPKLSKKTPKSELKESSSKSSTLKRTKSLKVSNEENSVEKTPSSKLRRTKSLNMKQVGAEDSPKEALKRKSLKKLQENTEPNEQETDRSTRRKVSTTPSFNQKNLKKQVEVIDPGKKLTDVSDTISDTMTPNTRRKSLRITRASMKDSTLK